MKACGGCFCAVCGKAGPDCPVRKFNPGMSDAFSSGCNLHKEIPPPVGPQDSQHALQRPEPVMHDKAPAREEKELQRACEGWLANRGYRRMTAAESIASAAPNAETRGWFFHLYIGRPNSKVPLLADLMIFTADMTQCLPIELKAADDYQPGQREMIDRGRWVECRGFDGFRGRVTAWEKYCENCLPSVSIC